MSRRYAGCHSPIFVTRDQWRVSCCVDLPINERLESVGESKKHTDEHDPPKHVERSGEREDVEIYDIDAPTAAAVYRLRRQFIDDSLSCWVGSGKVPPLSLTD